MRNIHYEVDFLIIKEENHFTLFLNNGQISFICLPCIGNFKPVKPIGNNVLISIALENPILREEIA